MPAPPLLLDRPPVLQIILAVVLPALLGVVAGILLGVSKTAYTVMTLVLLLGALAAGFEHPDADQGALRGLCGGLVFGTVVLAVHAVAGNTAKASLPHPHGVLVVIFMIFSAIAGAIGGALRGRRERRHAPRDEGRAEAAEA